MKVLKFGGTSVANAANIQRVKSIVENTKSDRVFVVVSALGGITDLLMEALNRASKNDKGYAQVLEAIEKRHLETVKALFPPQAQSAILGKVKTDLNALEF